MSPTRRSFLVSTGVAAATGTLLRPRLAHALQAQQQPEPTFTPIRRNVGFFTMRGGTIGWLVNDDAVVAVDSQFPAEAAAFLAGLDARSGGRRLDALVNTHHHGDHSGGNAAFRGRTRMVVAHRMADEHMRNPPGAQPPADLLFPDTTFTDSWSADVGDERVRARHYGRAHTSGDAIITFEQANVAHMGDLLFHRRHPVVDRAAGATMRGWMEVLDRTVADHARDTVYIFGHAATGLPVTGTFSDLERFRDYLGAVLDFADRQLRAGRSAEEVLAMRDALRGFEEYGPFGQRGDREALTCAVAEVQAAQ